MNQAGVRAQVKRMLSTDRTKSYVAKLLGISRQRVHQIVGLRPAPVVRVRCRYCPEFFRLRRQGRQADACPKCRAKLHNAKFVAARKLRYATDPAYREKIKKVNRLANREYWKRKSQDGNWLTAKREYEREYHKSRYHSDPAFRDKQLAATARWLAKKQAEVASE